jgi:putative polyhydroxyalkanoate system protein
MSEIRIRRKHDFPHDAAKKAADRMATDLKERFSLTGHWKGDALHFSGAGIDGVLHLEAKAVEIDAKLGFMLALMKPVIEASIHENLDRLFAAGHKTGKHVQVAKKKK